MPAKQLHSTITDATVARCAIQFAPTASEPSAPVYCVLNVCAEFFGAAEQRPQLGADREATANCGCDWAEHR